MSEFYLTLIFVPQSFWNRIFTLFCSFLSSIFFQILKFLNFNFLGLTQSSFLKSVRLSSWRNLASLVIRNLLGFVCLTSMNHHWFCQGLTVIFCYCHSRFLVNIYVLCCHLGYMSLGQCSCVVDHLDNSPQWYFVVIHS